MRQSTSGAVRVLHAADHPAGAETVATHLEREHEQVSVETVSGARAGLDHLADHGVDCIVSAYELRTTNGVEFLAAVREEFPDLPFILVTDAGSEAVASEAISAGVTDYLRKRGEPDQYATLASRILAAVEQYRSGRAREARDRRLSLFVEQSPLGVIEWDEEFRAVCVNDAAESILGYDESDLCGESWETLVPASERGDVPVLGSDLADAEGGSHSLTDVVRADGRRITCEWHTSVVTDESGDAVATVSQFQDVTDRTERRRELERRTEELEEQTNRLEQRYRYLFEEAPVMAAVTRAENGRPVVEDCNQQFVETLGYETEAVIGRELADLYTPESRRRLLEEGGYERALAGEFVREDRELVTADGEQVETVLRAVPRRDGREETVGTLALFIDISERKQLERQKERLEEFTSIVSHDLRNPLNVAKSRAELVGDDCDSDHLEPLIDAQERMEGLIEDLLTLARSGEDVDELTPIDLSRLCDRCWESVVTDTATLETDTAAVVRADRSRLQQLLENLYRNSVKHGGADVTVTVSDMEDGFAVADDGPGIPPETREAVFDAGYSTVEGGTGFGLSIVEQVAEAHDWELRVTDSDAGGARFEFTGVEFAGDPS